MALPSRDPLAWDRRYREGEDGWELGRPAPPLQAFLEGDPRAPGPAGTVLVPGCGRGHEARLLADRGFHVVGLDISGEALREARRIHGEDPPRLRWLQADLLDADALAAAGLGPGSLRGVVEHTCFCAIDPALREAWLEAVRRLLAPGGWLLGLFWCHGRQGGPPHGADPAALGAQLRRAGLLAQVWEPALGSARGRDGTPRDNEWLGLWRRPVAALTIGGSDSGGGAGIQADLKTFSALGVHGCCALTCVTAQNTLGVERVDALTAAALTAQVAAVINDLPVAALKTGMLLKQELIEATASAIAPLALPRVIDPVMVSRAGAVLLEEVAIEAVLRQLVPLATLLTPNVHEAALLSGGAVADAAGMERAAGRLGELGAGAVLVKGGGLPELRGTDLLWHRGELLWLRDAPIDTPHTHGSGCTISAAVTAHLALGLPLVEAVREGRRYVRGALRWALAIGAGQGPLCHWHRQLAPVP
ncbi:MAG: bifunctional hydroxymethylpyrimidine kinase/phosphomethylpyrimidine kinase [Synechococcaceae cyanobacterium]|nr:bifunctional hydroxymethylpyrimidine kinase/phosphomethylpyrimidine kinase [Synechococcaceae cyanobacterium]